MSWQVNLIINSAGNTNGTSFGKNLITPTAGTIIASNTHIIAAFNRGFSIKTNLTVPQGFRPGYILDFGIYSTTQIWYSVEAVLNT